MYSLTKLYHTVMKQSNTKHGYENTECIKLLLYKWIKIVCPQHFSTKLFDCIAHVVPKHQIKNLLKIKLQVLSLPASKYKWNCPINMWVFFIFPELGINPRCTHSEISTGWAGCLKRKSRNISSSNLLHLS
jgi:hypothetical protein